MNKEPNIRLKKSFDDLIDSEKHLKNILQEHYNVEPSPSSRINDNNLKTSSKMSHEMEENGAIESNNLDDVDREVIKFFKSSCDFLFVYILCSCFQDAYNL